LDYPTINLDTLPSRSGGNPVFRTGSRATRNCVSRFGLHDVVGNISEWNIDRCNLLTNICQEPTTTLDATATDLYGWDASGFVTETPLASNGDFFLPGLGIPWNDDGNNYGTIPKTSWNSIHGDSLRIEYNPSKAVISDGNYKRLQKSGRHRLLLHLGPGAKDSTIGFRCVVLAD
jgi:hypothetical protein